MTNKIEVTGFERLGEKHYRIRISEDVENMNDYQLVKINRSWNGAGYAKEWQTLPDSNMDLLKHLITIYNDKLFTKEDAKNTYTKITSGAFNGRFSELYGCGILIKGESKQVPHKDHIITTVKVPQYKIDMEYSNKIILNRGKL